MEVVQLTKDQAKKETRVKRIGGYILCIIFVIILYGGLIYLFPNFLNLKYPGYIVAGVILLLTLPLWIPVKPIICEECNSDYGYRKGEKVIATNFKHARKNGQPDKRFKDNPKINTIKTTKICINCHHQRISTKKVEASE